VATAVMTIGVVGMTGAFLNVQKAMQGSKNKSLASNLVQEKVQILTQKNYYEVLVTPPGNPVRTDVQPNIKYDTTYFPAETILEGGVTYTRYTYVQVVTEDSGAIVVLPPTAPDTGMRMITVAVVWYVGGLPQTLQVNTILTNPSSVMTTSVIKGVVTDQVTGLPIAGALVDMAENLGWRDTTDVNGKFSINAAVGNFTMVANMQGYFNQYTPVSIAANAIQTQNFVLQPMSSGTVTGTAWMNQDLVISQVVADTNTICNDGLAHDVEYIELFNPTTAPINLGQSTQWPWQKPYSLWVIAGENPNYFYGYDYPTDTPAGGPWSYDYFNFQYISTYVPAGSYFLIANADRFMINGVWVTPDATYHPLYSQVLSNPAYKTKAGFLGLQHGYFVNNWADTVRWDSATSGAGGAPNWAWPQVSTTSIANYGAVTSLGSPAGNSFVRLSSPTASQAGTDAFGRAYNSKNNQVDFYYSRTSSNGIPVLPRNISSGTYTVISGVPALGAIVTGSDVLSNATTAYLAGPPARADFVLVGVATTTSAAPWVVVIASNGYVLENDTVTVPTQGFVYNFPSSTTILNQPASSGYIAGQVTDVLGAPITAPSAITVTAAGVTQSASVSNGRYLLRVSTGSIDVTANPNAANVNYVSVSSLNVTVQAGIISDGVDFILSQGGRVSGFVTRDGVNALPGVTVTALDINGFARDTEVSDATGRFTTIIMATGTYNITPELDSLETSSPTASTVVLAVGQNIFSSTFTITGALGTVAGTVTSGGQPVSTGVLIVVTTVTLAGSPPVPPSLSSSTLTGASYYVGSSKEDGTYSIDVRQSTSPAYRVYGYYTTVASTGASISAQTLTNVQVLSGQVSSGNNLAW
jgi:hypothetical protein